jgi:hypothetical protein
MERLALRGKVSDARPWLAASAAQDPAGPVAAQQIACLGPVSGRVMPETGHDHGRHLKVSQPYPRRSRLDYPGTVTLSAGLANRFDRTAGVIDRLVPDSHHGPRTRYEPPPGFTWREIPVPEAAAGPSPFRPPEHRVSHVPSRVSVRPGSPSVQWNDTSLDRARLTIVWAGHDENEAGSAPQSRACQARAAQACW